MALPYLLLAELWGRGHCCKLSPSSEYSIARIRLMKCLLASILPDFPELCHSVASIFNISFHFYLYSLYSYRIVFTSFCNLLICNILLFRKIVKFSIWCFLIWAKLIHLLQKFSVSGIFNSLEIYLAYQCANCIKLHAVPLFSILRTILEIQIEYFYEQIMKFTKLWIIIKSFVTYDKSKHLSAFLVR